MKKTPSKQKLSKKKQNSEIIKSKYLFDHLDAIRTHKDPNYYDNLTESEKKSFNHWAILHGLSMDVNLIDLTAFLWKDGYYDKIPPVLFYKLLIELVPKTTQRLFWIKRSQKRNVNLFKIISTWYSISYREAEEYFNIFTMKDDGYKEIGNILEGMGYTDKESEEILGTESEKYE